MKTTLEQSNRRGAADVLRVGCALAAQRGATSAPPARGAAVHQLAAASWDTSSGSGATLQASRFIKSTIHKVVCLLIVIAVPAALQAFVGVDRGELLFKLVPGQGAASTVTVTNSGTELSTVSLSIEDFKIADGRPNFSAQVHSRALASRLTVFPTSFELKAGESREVQVLLDPGDGPFEAGTYWAVVFVQTSRLADMVPPGGDRQVQVRVVERVGVFAFADAEPEPRPLPDDVEITGLENAGKNLVVSVKNPSRYLRLVTEGYVLATPLSGGAAQRWPMQTFRVLPDSVVRMEIPVPEAAAGMGRCNVLVALDYGAVELVAGEQEFEF